MPLTEHQQLRILHQHDSLQDLLRDISEAKLRMAPEPGKWSVFENVAHLASYQHTFLKRLDEILLKTNPVFERYTAEADPLFHDYLTMTLNALMEDLRSTRQQIAEKLMGLSEELLQRRGAHPVYGNMTLTGWTEFFILHEAHHLFTVFKLLNRN